MKTKSVKTIEHRTVYENDWMTVYEDDVEFSAGKSGLYGYVERVDGSVVLAVSPDHRVLLNHEYRYPITDFQWEIPGGGIDPDETPEEAAYRELKEETGIKDVIRLERIGEFYPLASCSSEKNYLFVAYLQDDLHSLGGEYNEMFGDQVFIPIKELMEMIDAGEITDAFTCNALQILARKLEKEADR